jgi:glycosyltransferase involved in cell wall biosynthesis
MRAGYGSATHVYSMLGECAPFLVEAHERGLEVVSEVYIPLSTERILAEERRAFSDWEPDVPDFASIRHAAAREDVLLTRSHHFICPSAAVLDDLIAHFGIARDRTSIVPYGVHPDWLSAEPRPARRRILFVGEPNLRKGIHYLAMAAARLRTTGHAYEFRVAGNVARPVAQQPLCRDLLFLGRVPRDRIHEEFAAADVFVLPSLAEGSAAVTYEALAAGVPVVTTRAAGSVVRDGIDGRLVPERDPVVLADAIAGIVEDRERRARMSLASRQRARDYTWERYGERLVGALRSLASQ